MAENVLFGSEFDSRPIIEGVNEVVTKLAEIKQAQKSLREEATRLNKALDDNQKTLKETAKLLAEATKAGDAKKIKELSDAITVLTAKEKELKVALKEVNVEQVVLQKGASLYSKQINETVRNQRAATEEFSKFRSISRLAGEGVGLLRREVTGAAFALVSGFAGGIIATVLPAIVSWITAMINAKKELDNLQRQQLAENEIQKAAVAQYAAGISKLEILKGKLNDTTLSEKDRLTVLGLYNKEADKQNQIDTTQINNLDLINEKVNAQIALIRERGIARAAEAIIGKKAEDFLTVQEQIQEILPDNLKATDEVINSILTNGEKALKLQDRIKLSQKGIGAGELLPQIRALAPAFFEAEKELNSFIAATQKLVTVQGLTTKGGAGDEKTNVFEREVLRLTQRLKTAQVAQFPSESLIAEQFESKVNKELKEVDKFLDAKSNEQVTPAQAEFLKKFIRKINDVELEGELENFRKRVQDLQDKLNDQIIQLRGENTNKRIANIRDDFEREKQQIEQGFDNTVVAINKAQTNLFKQIDDAEKAGLDPAIAKRKKLFAGLIFGDLLDQAQATKDNANLDLSFKVFQKTLTESNVIFEESLTDLDVNIAARIVKEKDELARGAINYEKFQKNVTALLKQQKEERDQIRREELVSDLQQINVKINATTDPEQLAQLKQQARTVKEQIAAIDSSTEAQKQDPTKKRTESLIKYAQTTQQVLSSIIGFWQQVNAAEQKSLEQSINLQTKRVEEARAIAERGNAQYLNEEQDRLDQLELKRAASARKQQAINSALVLSQALVATVSAIAQAASTSGPAAPFAAIAAGIAVIGAITAAFQFVSSLQPPVATFFKGTEEVTLGNNKPGIDTVPARLTAGERVVTAKENKDYFPTLSAIHNRKVSPEVLNSFVRQTLTGQKEAQPENRLPGKEIQRFRETAQNRLQERHTKEREVFTDKLKTKEREVSKEAFLERQQLTREIATQVSELINNTQDKTAIFNQVEKVLMSKLEQRPLVVPQIMKLITERVNQKETSTVTSNVQAVTEVLESFSDRITERFTAKKFKRTFHEKSSEHLVDKLSEKLVTNLEKYTLNVDRTTEKTDSKERIEKIDQKVEKHVSDIHAGDITERIDKQSTNRIEQQRLIDQRVESNLQLIKEQLTERVNVQDAAVVVPFIMERLKEKLSVDVTKMVDHLTQASKLVDRKEVTKTDAKETKAVQRVVDGKEKTVEAGKEVTDKIQLISLVTDFAREMNNRQTHTSLIQELATVIHNNEHKAEVFRDLQQQLETKFNTTRVNEILNNVKERVNEKDRSTVTSNFQEVLERFTTDQDKQTHNLVERLTDKLAQFEDTQSNREVIRETLQERLTVPEAKTLVPAVLEKISTKELVHTVKEFAKGMNERVIDRAQTTELIRQLSQVVTKESDLEHVERHLTERIANPETVKLLVPLIREQLKNNIEKSNAEKTVSSTKENASTLRDQQNVSSTAKESIQHRTERTIERQFREILANPVTKEQLIQHVNNDVFTKNIHRVIQNLATLPNADRIIEKVLQGQDKVLIDRLTEKTQMIQVEKSFAERLKQADRIETQLKEVLSNPETTRQLIQYINHLKSGTVIHGKIHNIIQQLVQLPGKAKERIFDRVLLNQQAELVERFTDTVNSDRFANRSEKTEQTTAKIIERFADKVNKTEQTKLVQQSRKENFIRENQDYRESVEAILDRKIQSSVVNQFVHSMTKERDQKTFHESVVHNGSQVLKLVKDVRTQIPVVSYDRLSSATSVAHENKGMFAEQIRILKENMELQRENNRILKVMGFSFNFDKNGVSAMMMKYMDQKKIDTKS